MKLLIKISILIVAVISIILVVFLMWASSGSSGKDHLSRIKTFNENIKGLAKKKSYRIMTFNCGYFSGMRNNLPIRSLKNFYIRNLQLFIDRLKRSTPDIICFQEMDFNSHRSHWIDQMEYLAESLKFRSGAYAVNWDKKYVPFPYWPPSAHFKKILSGQSVLSMYPIAKNRRIVLKRPDNSFFYNLFYLDRLIQESEIRIGEKSLIIMNIHLEAFDKRTREEQAGFVMDQYREKYKNKTPVIILGDFNCVPPGVKKKNNFSDEPETDYTDERTIDMFLNEDSLSLVIPENGENINTFPSDYPDRKLDYIFFTKNSIEMLNTDIYNINSSDHLPVMMQFRLK